MAEEGSAAGWIIALIAIVVVAIAATLLPFSVPLLERVPEVAAIVLVLLVFLWVETGGLQRRRERRAEIVEARAIQQHPEAIESLLSISRRAWEIFGEGSTRVYSFDAVGLNIENGLNAPPAGFGHPSADELRSGEAARSIRRGWDAGSGLRAETYNEIGRLLSGAARTNSREFQAASSLTNAFLQSAYSTAQSYAYEVRRANPTRFRPEMNDEWERFRDAANGLADRCREFGLRWATALRLVGAWEFRSVPTLVLPKAEPAPTPAALPIETH